MIRAVFDTNVFISALFNPKRPPAQLLELALQGKIKLIISPHLLGEIERVLTYPRVQKLLKKRKTTPREIEEAIFKTLKIAVWAPGNLTVEAIPDDPADDLVLACALEGHADVIVSGDHHLLDLKSYQGIDIVSPAEFLKMLENY
jgi:putative PIN family toxin of toxin-antitoxin system